MKDVFKVVGIIVVWPVIALATLILMLLAKLGIIREK